MDIISLIVSFVGVLLSAVALWSAQSAKALARRALLGRDQHDDVRRAEDLVRAFRELTPVLNRRSRRNADGRARGKPLEEDIVRVRETLDRLKTSRPLSAPKDLQDQLEVVVDEFEKGLVAIDNRNAERNGWQDILTAAQSLIPELESYARQARNEILL